jgi:hypothetical protein
MAWSIPKLLPAYRVRDNWKTMLLAVGGPYPAPYDIGGLHRKSVGLKNRSVIRCTLHP